MLIQQIHTELLASEIETKVFLQYLPGHKLPWFSLGRFMDEPARALSSYMKCSLFHFSTYELTLLDTRDVSLGVKTQGGSYQRLEIGFIWHLSTLSIIKPL